MGARSAGRTAAVRELYGGAQGRVSAAAAGAQRQGLPGREMWDRARPANRPRRRTCEREGWRRCKRECAGCGVGEGDKSS
jgi:hypothetical protein